MRLGGSFGREVSRLFRSFGSDGADHSMVDQDATVTTRSTTRSGITGSGEMPFDPVWDGYHARHAQPDADAGDHGEANEWDGTEDYRFVVRPYSWTRGRTRPAQDLAVETLVSTSDEGRDLTSVCSAEHAAIAQLCTEIRSVAEVAALLALPLGVARVLLADMIDTGLVYVHRNPLGADGMADLSLLERVLDGLHRL